MHLKKYLTYPACHYFFSFKNVFFAFLPTYLYAWCHPFYSFFFDGFPKCPKSQTYPTLVNESPKWQKKSNCLQNHGNLEKFQNLKKIILGVLSFTKHFTSAIIQTLPILKIQNSPNKNLASWNNFPPSRSQENWILDHLGSWIFHIQGLSMVPRSILRFVGVVTNCRIKR